ncbi:MAG: HD domain-containing protein [Candidatus Saganbacteria bacterium]|nr:HD domain-containing protein [Candidatus Saganbacteria bacterium]
MTVINLLKTGRTRSSLFVACRSPRQAQNNFIRNLLKITANLGVVLSRLSQGMMKDMVRSKLADYIDLANELSAAELDDFIKLMELAVQKHDPVTADHQKRVTEICGFVADNIDLPVNRSALIRAARLHDLGKIGWPPGLREIRVSKKGGLREIIKTHLFLSLYFIEAVDQLVAEADIVRFNHIFDGYPADLEVSEMPLEAHILSAADYIDALISPRTYRRDRTLAVDYAIRLLNQRDYPREVKSLVRMKIENN